MRGGLGRTLLTAFLLLVIGPLSIMSLYAIDRTRQENQRQQAQQMALLAESYRAQIELASQRLPLNSVAGAGEAWYSLDTQGQPRLQGGAPAVAPPTWVEGSSLRWQIGGTPPSLWVVSPVPGGWVGQSLPLHTLFDTFDVPVPLQDTALYIQDGELLFPLSPTAETLPSSLLSQLVTQGGRSGLTQGSGGTTTALYGRAPLTEELNLLVVRPEAVVRAASDTLAAALVATAILTALVTTVGAALLTRRITRPLYELTRTAVRIARGDLTQRAQVDQDNELGILALAFNMMAAQLQDTLETLEERVEKRTEELRQANAKIRARARQLELSAEIGTVISSIHDLDRLLQQGTRLIASTLGFHDVSIWLLGRRPGRDPGLTLRACVCPDNDYLLDPESSELEQVETIHLAEQALQRGKAVYSEDRRKIALPLRMADNLLGSIILAYPPFSNEIFEEEGHPHLQTLADAFGVSIENARALEVEGAALDKLRQIELRRAQFLGQMSHELSTALNSIIGFSDLMLKEIEGPLTDMQRSDLTYINRNGTHLLSLLDGMLDVIDGGQLHEEGSLPSLEEK